MSSEPTEALEKKLNQMFNRFDYNGDGLITEGDIESMTQVFCAVAEENDEKHKNLIREGMTKWWRCLLDAREDATSEQLGRREFSHCMRATVMEPDTFKITVGKVCDGMMGGLDRDGNGVLTLDEYLIMFKGFQVNEANCAECFNRIDRNGNGVIEHSEFVTAVWEFYTSTDPSAPGHWLLGPPEQLE